ncbi:MAG: hypothetical protein J5923_06460 [Acidaminococcaceae bacterium]|nr:hypothetical protein [Acidaminococcaceae bacterium]
MKKFLMVVMAMLLSLSMVAGCGGDKKAELLKGLKTEIGTMLGNVDKLASVAELKGEDAKKATEGLKGLMDKLAKLKEAAKGNAAAEKDVADLMGKAAGLSEKISRGLAAGNLPIDPKTFKIEDLEKNGWVAIKDAAGKITGYYDPKDVVTDELGKKAFAWILKVGEDGKALNFENVAFDFANGKVALNKEAVLENKDGVFSFAAAKDAIKDLVWGDGIANLGGLDLNGIFEKLKPQGWDMKKLAAAAAGAVTGDAAKAGDAAKSDKAAMVKDFIAFAEKNEATLKKLADSINSGSVDKAALLDLGKNALAEIKKANGDLNSKYADLMKPVAGIMQMQEDRAQAMIDGVNGNAARFSEGGNLKAKVLELLAQFKKENNL